MTTGLAFCLVEDGVWEGANLVEMKVLGSVEGGMAWWNAMCDGAMRVVWRIVNEVDAFVAGCGDGGEEWGEEPVELLICMEDFTLRLEKVGKAGMGGRSVVTPVGIGAVIWQNLRSFYVGDPAWVYDNGHRGRRLGWSVTSPAQKAAIGDGKIEVILGDSVGDVKSVHCQDALRHCVLGVRAF